MSSKIVTIDSVYLYSLIIGLMMSKLYKNIVLNRLVPYYVSVKNHIGRKASYDSV